MNIENNKPENNKPENNKPSKETNTWHALEPNNKPMFETNNGHLENTIGPMYVENSILQYSSYENIQHVSQEYEPDIYVNDLSNVFIQKYVNLHKDTLDWKKLSINPKINKKFIT